MRKNRQKKYNLYKIKAYETCKGNGNKNGKTKINFTNEIFFFVIVKMIHLIYQEWFFSQNSNSELVS